MNDELDDYDLFLESWTPGERLLHASLSQYLDDPLSRQRLLDDSTGSDPVAREPYREGLKLMGDDELRARAFGFFEAHQARWAAHFRDYVLGNDVPEEKFKSFANSFAQLWIDGRTRRQDSPEMRAIKASIREHDRFFHAAQAGRFVIKPVDAAVVPLFTPAEMATVFAANSGLLEALLTDYVDHLMEFGEGPGAFSRLYVRRGVHMPAVDTVRREFHELSSYSLALGPVEQFAQTWTPETRESGVPSIFSAPLPAIQQRVVAFAPFIEGMDLSQLELVVAPPVEEMPLRDDGGYGRIREFSFE